MQKKWSFEDKKINFDDHVKNSVPFYDETHKLISFLSTFFLNTGSLCYEIGCSTGTLIKRIEEYNKNNEIKYIGIEPSKKLISLARNKIKKKNIKFINKSIEDFNLNPSDLIISHFTLQFIDVDKREMVLEKIYNSIKLGGCFVFFEKNFFNTPEVDYIMSSVYNYDFKRSKNHQIEKIYEKAYSLRGVMKLHSENETLKLLKKFNYKNISSVFKWGQFTGYLCIK